MKKLYSVLGLIFCVCMCIVLSGCGAPLTMPNKDGGVKYNGGDVFTIGDYIYFANGYKSYSELNSGDNDSGRVKIGALVRVKLNENGELEYDEKGNLKNKVETVASKIAGSENSEMFVVGDYIYFASPNTHKTNKNENAFNLLSVQQVKLDGSGLNEVFSTDEYTDSGKFIVTNYNNKDYILVYTGSKIISKQIGGGKEKVIAEKVTSCALPNFGEEFNGNIYYTTNREDADKGIKGNVVKSINVENNEIKTLQQIEGREVTFILRENNTVYYKYSVNSYDEGIYSNDCNSASFDDGKVSQIVLSDVTDFKSMGFGALGHRGFVYNYQSSLWYQSFGGLAPRKKLVTGTATTLLLDGDYVYYSDGTNILRVGIKEETPVTETIIDKENMKTTKIDFDGRYIYFYAKQDAIKAPENEKDDTDELKKEREEQDVNSYYMYRYDTLTIGSSADKNYEFMGIKYKNTEL